MGKKGKQEVVEEKEAASDSSGTLEFRQSLQYGIYIDVEFDIDLRKVVDRYYPKILDDEKLNRNSTIIYYESGDDDATVVGIVIYEMATDGEDVFTEPGAVMAIDPHQMIETESVHQAAIDYITEIHEKLVREFKKLRLPHRELKLGWFCVEASWDVNHSEYSDSD